MSSNKVDSETKTFGNFCFFVIIVLKVCTHNRHNDKSKSKQFLNNEK